MAKHDNTSDKGRPNTGKPPVIGKPKDDGGKHSGGGKNK